MFDKMVLTIDASVSIKIFLHFLDIVIRYVPILLFLSFQLISILQSAV